MGNPYVAAFFLPISVTKRLSEIGWEFESSERLPEDLISVLESGLGLAHREKWAGIDVYEAEGLKATVIRDSSGQIEHVYFQLRSKTPADLCSALNESGRRDVELFVPSEADG